jgi:alkanesulfonate monooxygenase SsuD/methylene tetrahydromethanopterin reductase-like flavin-dependent oxidoreductase (luciferase family)
VKFLIVRLLTNSPDPATGERASASKVLGDAIAEASYFEDLGFDGYGIGEHHIDDAEASSPAVILGYLAASTKRIRLFTGVTVLSLLDPVRVAEDYATLDVLSDGRLDIIIGKGNTEEQSKVFGYTNDDQWDRNRENYELLRALFRQEKLTWSGKYRPPLVDFTSRPRPLQQPIRVWHGSATSTLSTDLAAKWGDPLFSANVSGPLEQYQELVDDYRRRWVEYGRDPADALVGAGSAGLHVHHHSQRAIEEFRPRFEAFQVFARRLGAPRVFESLEDAVARGSYFVGSPQQVIEQVHTYHDALGHEVQHTSGIGSIDDPITRQSLELFAAEVLPVLRRDIPDRLWEHRPGLANVRRDRPPGPPIEWHPEWQLT